MLVTETSRNTTYCCPSCQTGEVHPEVVLPEGFVPPQIPDPPATPRDSATVMLVRDGSGGIEVFLIRRVAGMAFAGGMTAFLQTEPGLGFLQTKPPDQTLGTITLRRAYEKPRIAELDAIAFSELVRDVAQLLK